MTVLVDWEIKNAINDGLIQITPFDESLVNPASLDIRLGDFVKEMVAFGGVIDPRNTNTFSYRRVNLGDEGYLLEPNSFVLAPMLEEVTLFPTIAAKLLGKSSMARLGLANSDAAGWCDNGWSGVLTQELFNHSKYPIKLTKGMKIGQLIFYKTEWPSQTYEKKGRYQNQKPGQGSLGV